MPGPKPQRRTELLALGAAVRRHREERGWTPDQLAAEAGVSRRTVGNVEGGLYNTGIGTILDIAHALGIRLVDLVGEAAVDPDI